MMNVHKFFLDTQLLELRISQEILFQ